MKKANILFIAILSIIMFSFNAIAEENQLKEEKFKTSVQNYMEKSRIESSIKKIDGVDDAFVSLDTKILTVTFDSKKVNINSIVKNAEDMKFSCELIKTDEKYGKQIMPKKESNPQ